MMSSVKKEPLECNVQLSELSFFLAALTQMQLMLMKELFYDSRPYILFFSLILRS